MWETQGPISNCPASAWPRSDAGIVMLRDLMLQEIEKVRQGLDPMGVMRDPDHAIVDTNLANENGRLAACSPTPWTGGRPLENVSPSSSPRWATTSGVGRAGVRMV